MWLTPSGGPSERDTDAPERQELARERDLLDRVRADDLARFDTKEAHVYRDPGTRDLTPEVRIPMRAAGWPVDWSAGQSIQYTFHAFSEKPRYN